MTKFLCFCARSIFSRRKEKNVNEQYLLNKFYKIENYDELKCRVVGCYGVSNYELLLKDKYGYIYSYDDYDVTIRCVFNPVIRDEIDQKFEFGYRLYKLIKRSYHTQREFAEATGLHEYQVSTYTSGKTIPNFETVMKIAKSLKCSTDELYCAIPSEKEFKNV